MSGARDHYEIYYADKLWALLPAIYRAQDSVTFGAAGPLREMVNRIGAEAAMLRRSIERMWDDQSIETCDDWIIPYIGDLLATRIVADLDARGQRLDVAKTIYYRRRKGTLAVLEEIAHDITGWDAKVVEFFRRLGRTRHGLDPSIGRATSAEAVALQQAEGLVGPLTRTPIGGFADLRNVYGASRAHTAFDEAFHTADLRAASGRFGWYRIPALGVFLWRLKSFALGPVTPVAVAGCPGWYSFDPTGRGGPLFAAGRAANAYGDAWVSPAEADLPTPIAAPMLGAASGLYPASLSVALATTTPPDSQTVAADRLLLRPAQGKFALLDAVPAGAAVQASYHYGFSSEIGAGPFDRRLGALAIATPAPVVEEAAGGTLTSVPGTGTLRLDSSLTWSEVPDVAVAGALTLQAANQERPLLRLVGRASAWVLTGAPGSTLTLDGLFLSGADIVLRGAFDSVTLSCCTLDPGSAAPHGAPGGPYAAAADGHALVPTRLWVEGTVRQLVADRCILGPIATRAGGLIESLAVSNSILQAVPAGGAAIALADGSVSLSRVSVLGRLDLHRLQASECILQDRAVVDDTQDGCVRFSAWADGSVLPRKYECVRIPPAAPLFVSTDIGEPGYAQLLAMADAQILPVPDPSRGAPALISTGAEDGAEMGAFAREKTPIKTRALLLKFQEYMPAGLVPVLIPVT